MDQESEGIAAPPPVEPGEPIARFEYDKGTYVRADGNPRPRAFNPKFDQERNRFETSVFRIANLAPDEVWAIGDLAGADRNKTATGYCSLPASGIAKANLNLQDDQPPARHAVIVGWSDAEEKRLESTQILAEAAAGGGKRR